MKKSRLPNLTEGQLYYVAICPSCGRPTPLFEGNERFSITGSTINRKTCFNPECRTRFIFAHYEIRKARFEANNLHLLPMTSTENHRYDKRALIERVRRTTRLFKYVPQERIDILTKKQIRFTPPSQCNDASELMPALDESVTEGFMRARVREKWKAITDSAATAGLSVETFPSIDDIVVEYAKESLGGKLPPYIMTYRDEFGILSLTEEPDNPVMWGHYAGNGTGMVLEFSPPALVTPGRYKVWGSGGIWPVVYSSKRSYNFEQLDAAALTHEKGMEWSYEREWRIVRRLTECTSVANGLSVAHDMSG